MNLNTPITNISGIGKTTANKFKKLGIERARDALFYFPFKYKDLSRPTPISDIKEEIEVNVVGNIELIQNKRSQAKKMYITEALISDDSGEIKVIWFNQSFITKNLKVGDKVSLAGKAKIESGNTLLVSPVYEKLGQGKKEAVHTQGLIPQYPATEKLTQKQIRYLIKKVLHLSTQIPEYLPNETKHKLGLKNIDSALKEIHFPSSWQELERSKYRLSFDELFLIQVRNQKIKKDLKELKAIKVDFMEEQIKEFVSKLPFTPTYDQKKAAWEIIQDLEKSRPMARMLEGDVGSGKTLVAAIAILNTALNKDHKQSVLMVPTEILAEQHFHSLNRLFAKQNIKLGLLSRDNKKINFSCQSWDKAKTKKDKADIISSECSLVIGTHSLIQEKIEFKNLVLAIIDEQHRFGVEQRKTLTKKSGNELTAPHFLSMTATPIPRSLALGLFGDLDISIIKELPTQKKPIITKVVPEEKRQDAYNFIREQIDQGRQVFVVCPLVDPSDKLGVKSSKEEYLRLQEQVFPDKKIDLLHGKMKAKEKEGVMNSFLKQEFDILVSTSVVEVGVDVANATVMVIEGAERFGLAQLHQFRGRVGRGSYQSYCFLFSENNTEKTRQRLKSLEKYDDGFNLAQIDLKLRGSGEIYGTAQKGFPELKIADLWDYKQMKTAQKEAEELIRKDPDLKKHPLLKRRVDKEVQEIHLE